MHAERKKVFAVTGGTGFLGTHLVQRLVRDGHAVRMLVRSDPGDALRESGGMCVRGDDDVVESVYGSLENDNDVRELLLQQRRDDEGMFTKEDDERVVVDGVYHLAGLVVHSRRRNVVEELQCVNVDGAVRVVRIAMELGVARACIVSTSGTVAVRADASISADDESNGDGMHTYAELARRWPYYKSKIDMEQAVSTMTKTMDGECPVTEIVMVRPSLLLGPGDRRLSSCKTVADLLKRRLPIVPPGGLNFVDVRDAADASVAAFEKGDNGEKYLIAGPNLTTERFFQEVTTRACVPMPMLRLPAWLTIFIAKMINAVLTLIGKWNATFDPVLAEMGCAFWYVDDTSAAESNAQLGIHMRDWGTTIDDTIEWLRQFEVDEEAKAKAA